MQHDRSCGATGSRHGSHDGGCLQRDRLRSDLRRPGWHGGSDLSRLAPQGNPDTCAATYVPCPGVLIMDHFFEGANPEIGGIVNTDLTLVPCSENLGDPAESANFEVVAQMLVYNEFEQRFSLSTRVECYRATTLADLDTRAVRPATRSRSSRSASKEHSPARPASAASKARTTRSGTASSVWRAKTTARQWAVRSSPPTRSTCITAASATRAMRCTARTSSRPRAVSGAV